ncbi:MAG: PD40 domain-containing protein [Bryobacterales bacterium]|nr:PD40 domain-containing protein [Bryobacterales bacterium]
MERRRLSRRGFLAAAVPLPTTLAFEKGKTYPLEGIRYADPATEFPVERFTDPAYSSYLPAPYARAIARKGLFFLFSCDREGSLQAYRFELKGGEIRQLTQVEGLHPATLSLMPDDKSFAFVAGRSVYISTIGSLRERELYKIPEDWELGDGFSVSADGIFVALIEKQGTAKSRLQLIGVAKGNATTLVEYNGMLRHPIMRPKRASVLYHRDDVLHLINYDGANDKRIAKATAAPGSAIWAPDGRTILYLQTQEKDNGVFLHEIIPDSMQDRVITRTTTYGNFASNIDGSVLVAASRSVAQPHVLIMIRTVKRELIVCEHKNSDPAAVAPIFSPTSQRIYFQSDRQGKPAIYTMVLEKFIEKTES